MKKIIVFILILSAGLRAGAQESKFPYNAGGFGHFYIGPAFFQPGDLTGYLESPAVLNTDVPRRPGSMIGGEGAGLIGRILVGGGGFGQNIVKVSTDSVMADVSYGAGYFKFGYMALYNRGNLGYIYGGVGWGGLNVKIENRSVEGEVRFNNRAPLQPGTEADYTLPTTFYDLGIGYKKIVTRTGEKTGGEGGFMIGLDLGCSILTSPMDWQDQKDEIVSGPPVPGAFLNPYLRLTIGGGGFGFK